MLSADAITVLIILGAFLFVSWLAPLVVCCGPWRNPPPPPPPRREERGSSSETQPLFPAAGRVSIGSGELRDGARLDGSYRLYPARFWVLFQVSFLSFNQCLFWLSFSPIAANAKGYFRTTDAVVAWWLNIGVVAAILAFPFTTFIAAQEGGLKRICVVSALAQAVAMGVRCVPALMGQQHRPWGLAVVFCAQFVIGVVGPAIMGVPPLMSAQWFGESERTAATAVSVLSNNFGAAAGFLLAPGLVKTPEQTPRLLYAHAAIAVANAVLILAHFPAAPPTPPSGGAKLKLRSSGTTAALLQGSPIKLVGGGGGGGSNGGTGMGPKQFIRGARKVVGDRNVLTIALSGGILNGVFNVWSGSFDQILPALNPQVFTQDACSQLGFWSTIAFIIGGLLIGLLADRPPWNRRMKKLLLGLAVVTSLISSFFTFALPTALGGPFIHNMGLDAIRVGIVLASGTLGAMCPLFYESCAEITFPEPEVYSSNVIIAVLNSASFVFLFIVAPLLKEKVLNLVFLGCAVLAVLGFAACNISYRRSAAEASESSGSGGGGRPGFQ